MASCQTCGIELVGKRKKYCSKICSVRGYQKNNRETYLASQKLRHEKDKLKDPRIAIFSGIKARAKSKGWEFNITIEDIDVPEYCPILGIKLERSNSGCNPNSPSVDRIDSTKGYIKGNIVVTSNRANFLKKDASIEELEKILDFYKGIQR